MSEAAISASCAGVRAEAPTKRSVSHRYIRPCASSRIASSAKKPNAMRQYRLRYHTGSDIAELVAGAPHRQDEARLRRVGLDLPPHPLDERVHAALGDVRLVAPDAPHERVAAEHDAAIAREQVEQLEFVRGQLDLA